MGYFNKTSIALTLEYEYEYDRIVANLVLRTLLAIYHLISNVRL